MEADYIQKPTKSYADEQNNSNGLKKTLHAQAAERTAKAAESEEHLKTQLKEDAEKHKLQKQEPSYQYSPDRPLNEQLHEAAANSKAVVQNDNTDELNRVREKAANQNKSRESGSTTNSPAEPTAQNAPNTATQNNNSNIIMQQRQNSRS